MFIIIIKIKNHAYADILYAVERAINLFKNKEKYEICRKNAFNSAIDVLDVAKAWSKEFCRLREKVIYNL